MIKGGYYIKARKIQDSEIAKAPPHIREIWDWLIKKVDYNNKGKYGPGTTFTTLKEISDELSWYVGYRKMSYSKSNCETALRWLRKRTMITTTRSTRGMFITICNYEYYQDPKNYEIDTEMNNETAASSTTRPARYIKEIKEKKKEISLSDPPGSNGESISKNKKDSKIYRETRECLPLARTLARIVQSQKNIDISSEKKLSWANEIRKLVFTSEKVSYERVSDALRWYRKNVGGEYVPVIESGSSLRTKFIKLENAIARDNGSAKNSSPGSRYRNKTKLDMNKKTKTLN